MKYEVEVPFIGVQHIFVTADSVEEAWEIAADEADYSGHTDAGHEVELWQTSSDEDLNQWTTTERN